MAVSQITTCDCCDAQIADTSVLNCVILTYLDESTGNVEQKHYGKSCGCGQWHVQQATDGLDHSEHPLPPPPVVDDSVAPPVPAPQPDPEPEPQPAYEPEVIESE